MPPYRLIAAGIALLLYFIAAALILRWITQGPHGMDVAAWQQVIVIFNAIGAIATTAAGVLLGVEIQHASTQEADRKAGDLSGQLKASQAAAAAALAHLEATDPTTPGTGVSAARSALLSGLASR